MGLASLVLRVNGSFERWATSYTGMDGGNPRGPIWIWGIEPGAGDENEENFKRNLKNPFEKLPYITSDNFSWFPKQLIRHKGCQTVCGSDGGEAQPLQRGCERAPRSRNIIAEGSSMGSVLCCNPAALVLHFGTYGCSLAHSESM